MFDLIRFSGPRWHYTGSQSEIMRAERYFDQNHQTHEGNLADGGLRCNLWKRSFQRSKMGFELDARPNSKRNWKISIASMQKSTDVVLQSLPKKIAHFIHDYLNGYIQHLKLPDSNGRHDQLSENNVRQILELIVDQEVEIFHRLQISHNDYHGKQFVHSHPCFFGAKRVDTVFIAPPPPFPGSKRT